MPGAGRAPSGGGGGVRAPGNSGGLKRLLAELTQRVVAALQKLARDRQARPVTTNALLGLEVVGAVRAALPTARDLRGLIQRPAQRRRPLAGDVSRRAAPIGLVH